MKFLRILLFPVSLIYAGVVLLRNLAYDTGIFKSTKFNIPVISVGNLVVGGTGKSPMTEYLIRLLKEQYKTATLSRGYGRNTKGFLVVEASSTAEQTGDEPLQFKTKFPEVTVAVCENRVAGIEKLKPANQVILLDDAYQHRAVKPGLSILLFDYGQVFRSQFFLPAGNLREPSFGRKRADIIVVTKTSEDLSAQEKDKIIEKIKPYPQQQIFFSYLRYAGLQSGINADFRSLDSLTPDTGILLLTGIVNPQPLKEKLLSYTVNIQHHEYADHHPFTRKNILKLAEDFTKIESPDKLIITTEKDMQRLKSIKEFELLKSMPVYYLPIEAKIHDESEHFDNLITTYVAKYLQHS